MLGRAPLLARLPQARLLLGGLLALGTINPAPGAVSDRVVFRTGFEPTEPAGADPASIASIVETSPGSHALFLGNTNASATVTRQFALPARGLDEARIVLSGRVKAEAVTAPPKPWNGIKLMLVLESGAAKDYPQLEIPSGTFDWQSFTRRLRLPRDLTKATLVVGLEQAAGRVWFDDLEVRLASPPRGTNAAVVAFKGHDLPRLRGAMIAPQVTAADLRVLGRDWGANHVRWQLLWGGFPKSPADTAEVPAYEAWLESALKHLDDLLPVCREVGLRVLIDLHTPPGGRNERAECRLFHEARFQDAFLRAWDTIARRYQDNPTIWGYDLVNEPVEGKVAAGLLNWQALADRTARRVREIDPRHAIILEPAPWGSPQSLDELEPLAVPGVVYSVHMYLPHQFTHQGVYDNPLGLVYPGTIQGRHYDKDALRQELKPVLDFQRETGAHIYIGEFSAIRWAPDHSAHRYLRDVIELFEESGWDWAYHAFREWNGWSVEHGPDRTDNRPAATPTDRQKLLQDWFAQNRKPAFKGQELPR